MERNSSFTNLNSRKKWRKEVKKLRRKKIRQKLAAEREEIRKRKESSPTFLTNLAKRLLIEQEKIELEDEERKLQHERWLQHEKDIQKRFRELQDIKEKEEKAKQEVSRRIQEEWKAAKRRKEEEQKLKEKKSELAKAKIENYIEHGGDIPEELQVNHESNPGRDACPFFSKVAACRFGPACSRNHVVPGISRVIVIPSFYTHFTLYQNRSAEYDTDVGLEFEERETYGDFCDFFDDALSELKRFGELTVIQVCRNGEPHLRGNLYAEYKTERWAFAAARKLHARWYAGKQLTVRFARIPDWGAAVCGDFRRGRCPKGSECNFLHVFRNPRGQLMPAPRIETPSQSSARSWRWSESPERHAGSSSSRSSSRHHSSRRRHRSRGRDHRKERRHSSKTRDDWSSSPEDRRSESRKKRRSKNDSVETESQNNRNVKNGAKSDKSKKESPLRSRNRS